MIGVCTAPDPIDRSLYVIDYKTVSTLVVVMHSHIKILAIIVHRIV